MRASSATAPANARFRSLLDDIREQLSAAGGDPIGEEPSKDISKRKLDKLLHDGDPEAAGVVHGAIEAFAQEFAAVIRRFMKLEEWQGTQSESSLAAACAAAGWANWPLGARLCCCARTASRSSWCRSGITRTKPG